jgi:hypothetical protein
MSHQKYARIEIAHLMCRSRWQCVACSCPVGDDEDGHTVTMCVSACGDPDKDPRLSISCEEGHTSAQVLEAVLAELESD